MYHLTCIQSSSVQASHSIVTQQEARKPFKWRRFFIIISLMLICFTFGAMIQSVADTGDANFTQSEQMFDELVYIDVVKGDSLWSIASKHAPQHEDIRKYIYKIKQLNNLNSSALQIGQVLRLP